MPLKTSVYSVPKTSAQDWRTLKSSLSLARWCCQPEHPHCAADLHGGQGEAGGLRGTGSQLRGTEGGDPEEPRVLRAQEGGAMRPCLGHHLREAPACQSRFVPLLLWEAWPGWEMRAGAGDLNLSKVSRAVGVQSALQCQLLAGSHCVPSRQD